MTLLLQSLSTSIHPSNRVSNWTDSAKHTKPLQHEYCESHLNGKQTTFIVYIMEYDF